MSKFFSGFALASLLWGVFLVAYKQGFIPISLEPEAPPQEATAEPTDEEPDTADKPGRPRRKRSVASKPRRAGAQTEDREALTGDDLGEDSTRTVDMHGAGGEEQLRGTEIEKAFDGAFAQIRRCLILAASDEPAHGKLTFGVRIAGSGKVTAVNLSGPSSVSQGECGACLRKAASAMQFRSFNGPDMVIHYPITLD
ncbi:MAG TPA: hypothetical protein VJV78_46930 [Polyangiales bacterium]|nr:hypothetical protein [Polyangiales bacterium]